jgi:hypothetical protein
MAPEERLGQRGNVREGEQQRHGGLAPRHTLGTPPVIAERKPLVDAAQSGERLQCWRSVAKLIDSAASRPAARSRCALLSVVATTGAQTTAVLCVWTRAVEPECAIDGADRGHYAGPVESKRRRAV